MQGAVRPPGGPPGPPPPPDTSSGGDKKNLFSQPKTDFQDDEEKKKTRPYVHLPRHGAAWLLFLAAIAMFASLGAPWWSWTVSSPSQSATYFLFIWGVVCAGPSCPGFSTSPLLPPTAAALTSGGFTANLGSLYGAVAAMSIIAAIFAVVAAAIMFRVARGLTEYPKAVDRAVVLSYLGLAISLAVPVMLSIAQTASFRGDFGFPINMSPTPGSAFYGAIGPGTYDHTYYSSQSWGPTYSWFLCVAAAALFFGGGIVPHLTRHDPVARRDLIRAGLLKLQAPIRRPLPAPFPARGLPAPYPMGAPGAFAPGRPAPMYVGPGPGRPAPIFAGYGPQYQSLAPGVGWARPMPPPGTPYRATPALPPGSRPAPGPGPAPPPAVYRPTPPAAYRPPSPGAPSAAPTPYRPTPSPAPTPAFRPTPTSALPTPSNPNPSRPTPVSMASRPSPASSPPPPPYSPPTPSPAARPTAPGAVIRPAPAATTTAAPARPPPPAVKASGNRTCPKCQTYVPPPALRCTKCGTLLPRS